MTRRPLESGRIELFVARTKNSSPNTFLGNSTPTSVSGVGNFPQRAKGPLRRRTQAPHGIIGVSAQFTDVCVLLVWPGRENPGIRAPTEGTSDRRYQPNRRVSNSSLGKLMCRRYDTGDQCEGHQLINALLCSDLWRSRPFRVHNADGFSRCVAKFEKIHRSDRDIWAQV